MMKNNKNIEYYLNFPWTYTIERETYKNSSYYIIHVNELPGICTDAESLDEGIQEIKDAIACAFEIYLERGEPLPIKKNGFTKLLLL